MAAEHNDFNIDFGDTIYSDPEVPGVPPRSTVPQKWGMYSKKMSMPNMQKIRASTGIYNHWDDHEFINDFSIPENGRQLYNRSVTAFRDYSRSPTQETGIYRTVPLGQEPRAVLPRRALVPKRQGVRERRLRQPGHGPAGPGADRARRDPQPLRGAHPLAHAAGLPGCKDAINRPERPCSARPVKRSWTTSRARTRSGRSS